MDGSSELPVPIPILSNGKNYKFWATKMRTFFESQGLWKIVEDGIVVPEVSTTLDEKSKQKDSKALFIIQQALSEELFPNIVGSKSAKEAWDAIQSDFLTNEKINVEARDSYMQSRVYKEAANGKLAYFLYEAKHLEKLLTPNKNTILQVHITARTKDTEPTCFVEKILQTCPALLWQTNVQKETPLHLASRYGHASIVKLLIQESKNDAKKFLRMKDEAGNTGLHEAVRFQHLEVVKILTMEDPFFKYHANNAEETPLYLAVEGGKIDVVNAILENSQNPSYTGPCGKNVLHAAVLIQNIEITTEILEKVGVFVVNKADNKYGWTPLHYAANLRNRKLVYMLLQFDTNTAYTRDKEGRTSFHIASFVGATKIMSLFQEYCPDCHELVDNKGRNILHYAGMGESAHAIDFILERSSLQSLLREKDMDGKTPNYYINKFASQNSQLSILQPQLHNNMVPQARGNMASIIFNESIKRMKYFTMRHLRRKGTSSRSRQQLLMGENNSQQKGDHKKGTNDDDEDDNENKYSFLIERAREANLIVAALIATVTFAAGFTMPGGYVNEKGPNQGTAILRTNIAFNVFMVADTIAMVLSTSAAFIHLFLAVGREKNSHFSTAFHLTMFAMGAMVIAFITGTYAVLGHSTALAISICVISLTFFLIFHKMVPLVEFVSCLFFLLYNYIVSFADILTCYKYNDPFQLPVIGIDHDQESSIVSKSNHALKY